MSIWTIFVFFLLGSRLWSLCTMKTASLAHTKQRLGVPCVRLRILMHARSLFFYWDTFGSQLRTSRDKSHSTLTVAEDRKVNSYFKLQRHFLKAGLKLYGGGERRNSHIVPPNTRGNGKKQQRSFKVARRGLCTSPRALLHLSQSSVRAYSARLSTFCSDAKRRSACAFIFPREGRS